MAEVALVPLKSCLVNLPPSLVSMLVNANAVSCRATVISSSKS
jgi:peroxin-1